MAIYDGGECNGQIRKRINRIELARFDELRGGRPFLSLGFVSCKECVITIERNRPYRSLDAVVVFYLYATVVGKGWRPSKYLAM